MEKSFQTKEQLNDFFKTLSRGTTPDLESADISTSAAEPQQQPHVPSQALSSELDSHAVPQEMIPYHFKGNTTDLTASPAEVERMRGAEIYATMPRNKPRSKVQVASFPAQNSLCATPVSGQQYSPKKQLITGSHPRSAAARRAEGFSELLQFTRQQQFTPIGDMDACQSLPSFASGQLSLDDTRGIPLDDENELRDDLGESGSVGLAVSKSLILPQPSDEILNNNVHPSQHGESFDQPCPSQDDSGKVSTAPQLEVLLESSELEEPNGKPSFTTSPPLGETEKEDSRGVVHVADGLKETSRSVETNGLLDDAKVGTDVDIAPPLGDAEREEESEKSRDIVTEKLIERSEESETVMETSKSEEATGREEFISPPLADSNDGMEEKELAEPQDFTAESVVGDSQEPTIASVDDSELHDSSDSGLSRETTPQTADNDHEISDKTEANRLQQNGDSPYHLQHRATGTKQQTEELQDQPEPETSDLSASTSNPEVATSKEPPNSTTTSILDSSREERESSVESSASESHSSLIQQSSSLRQSTQAVGVLGWLHDVSRQALFGLLPRTVGLRGGLIVVGVAALSSFLLYSLTGYSPANSSASGK